MKYNKLTNQAVAALGKGLPVKLTVTMEGTGSATAWITGDMIIINCVAAELGKYIDLTTPIDFDVTHMHTIKGDATASVAITVSNGGTDLSDAVALTTADKSENDSSTIDDDNNSFSVDDDDLRLEIATAAFTGYIILDIDR